MTFSKNVTNALNETCQPSEKAAFSMKEKTPVYLTLARPRHHWVRVAKDTLPHTKASGLAEDKCTSETVNHTTTRLFVVARPWGLGKEQFDHRTLS